MFENFQPSYFDCCAGTRYLIIWVNLSHQYLESPIGYCNGCHVAMNDPSN